MNLETPARNELTFVYIGERLPGYAIASLNIAVLTSGLTVRLIANQSTRKQVKNHYVKFTAIEEFYNGERFESARKKISSNSAFRKGFWLRSLERFFILEQYWNHFKLESLLHAELDQLVFGVNELKSNLELLNLRGVFVPFQNRDTCVASIIYLNDPLTLESLLDEATNGDLYPNEMVLLARWATRNPSKAYALPTYALEILDEAEIVPVGVRKISRNETGGLVDAAQIGQWVGGIDPRNVSLSEKPKTKFVDSPEEWLLDLEQLSQLRFRYSEPSTSLKIETSQMKTPLYNLHLHSKSHSNLQGSTRKIGYFLEAANSPKSQVLAGMRKVQLISYFRLIFSTLFSNPGKFKVEIQKRANLILGRRPVNFPFLSGDFFRSMADHVWESESKEFDYKKIKSGDIIFCQSELISELTEKIISRIDKRVILVLGNSDENHSVDVIYPREREKIVDIYAQNVSQPIPGYSAIPIGIENAWRSKNGVISLRNAKQASLENRINGICWGFSIGTNPTERGEAARELLTNPFAQRIENVSQREHQKYLAKFKFVASPPGNGLDTHRTWEAMYFKCIPIVKRSFMIEEFKGMGLPLWIIDNYSELNSVDESFLTAKYDELKDGFNSEILWAPYWSKRILDRKRSLVEND